MHASILAQVSQFLAGQELLRVEEVCTDWQEYIRTHAASLWGARLSPTGSFWESQVQDVSSATAWKDVWMASTTCGQLCHRLAILMAYDPLRRAAAKCQLPSLSHFLRPILDSLPGASRSQRPYSLVDSPAPTVRYFHSHVSQMLRFHEATASLQYACSNPEDYQLEDGFVIIASALNATLDATVFNQVFSDLAVWVIAELIVDCSAHCPTTERYFRYSSVSMRLHSFFDGLFDKAHTVSDGGSAAISCTRDATLATAIMLPLSESGARRDHASPSCFGVTIADLSPHVPFLLSHSTGEQHVRALSRVLGTRLGLQGNSADYYNAHNSLLDRVLLTRKGLPITLSVVYAAVARRAGMHTVSSVALPGHFLLQYTPATESAPPVDGVAREEPLLFDPFACGAIKTKGDLSASLSGLGIADPSVWFVPPALPVIWHRCLSNLMNAVTEGYDTDMGCAVAWMLLVMGQARQEEPNPNLAGSVATLAVKGGRFDILQVLLQRVPMSSSRLSTFKERASTAVQRQALISHAVLACLRDRCGAAHSPELFESHGFPMPACAPEPGVLAAVPVAVAGTGVLAPGELAPAWRLPVEWEEAARFPPHCMSHVRTLAALQLLDEAITSVIADSADSQCVYPPRALAPRVSTTTWRNIASLLCGHSDAAATLLSETACLSPGAWNIARADLAAICRVPTLIAIHPKGSEPPLGTIVRTTFGVGVVAGYSFSGSFAEAAIFPSLVAVAGSGVGAVLLVDSQRLSLGEVAIYHDVHVDAVSLPVRTRVGANVTPQHPRAVTALGANGGEWEDEGAVLPCRTNAQEGARPLNESTLVDMVCTLRHSMLQRYFVAAVVDAISLDGEGPVRASFFLPTLELASLWPSNVPHMSQFLQYRSST